ncbi:RNA polymerase sigma factor [Sutcliffiella horikoshii]|uniref:RNA polymerase sigma factor n=1 Tax=Sutcliffiella horikoshii TaxID=79883 RepID=A0A5D4T4F4_9BACI|nr:RNA polymerase sigma factor [Sutcliffiella horikoshii]TYS69538.1 RNA polymerase sigma factor [Sutcliffiella horikoshii]
MEGELEKDFIKNHYGNLSVEYFEQIILENEKAIIKFAFTYVKDWAVAEDISQEVFIKVYKNIATFNRDSKLRTWLFSITANQCKDYLRKSGKTTKWLNDFFKGLQKQNDENPENILLEHEEKKSIGKALLSLPVKYREVLVLYYYEDLSTEEIAKLLHINSSTIRSRLERGRKQLKKWSEGGLK